MSASSSSEFLSSSNVAADSIIRAEARDRQARGRDPYQPEATGQQQWPQHRQNHAYYQYDMEDEESYDTNQQWKRTKSGKKSWNDGEPYQTTENRRLASQVLDSTELLMACAQREGESIPATRLRYTRMLCGVEGEQQMQQQQQQQQYPSNTPRRSPRKTKGASTSGGSPSTSSKSHKNKKRGGSSSSSS